jgi:tol-pal system protein YbgF
LRKQHDHAQDRIRSTRAIAACGLTVLLLGGCLAQQAELAQVERSLGTKIAKLDQREKELQQTISQKEKELQQALTKAKGEFDKMVGETRARLSQQLTELREADLPSMQGGLDKSIHQINVLRGRLDDAEHQSRAGLEMATRRLSALEKGQTEQAGTLRAERERLHDEIGKAIARLDAMNATSGAMAKTLGTKLDDHEKRIDAVDARTAGVIQQLESQNHALTDEMTQYGKSLAEFKKALAGLGDKLIQEEQRSQELSAKLSGRSDTLTAKLDADMKATGAHLNEVNKSVGSVAKALETMGGQVMGRVEDQDRRMDDMGKGIHSVDAQLGALSQQITQLRAERDAQIKAFSQSIAQLQAEREAQVNALNEAISQVNTLNQAVSQLRGERDTQVNALNETIAQLRAERETKVTALNETLAQVRAEQEKQEHAVKALAGQKESAAAGSPVRRDATAAGQEERVGSVPNGQRATDKAESSAGQESSESLPQARDAYERLIAMFRQGNLDGAAQGFLHFLARYPQSELAPNALYWLGECYYGKRDYTRAIEAFDRVKLVYPTSEKVPAALLKKGFAYLALKDTHRASSVWRQVVDGYPKSPEANKALEKLAQLKQLR